MMSIPEAKSRLLEAGRHNDSLATPLIRPAMRIAAVLFTGAYLGKRLRRLRKKESPAASSFTFLTGIAAAAAPLLVTPLFRSIVAQVRSRNSGDSPP